MWSSVVIDLWREGKLICILFKIVLLGCLVLLHVYLGSVVQVKIVITSGLLILVNQELSVPVSVGLWSVGEFSSLLFQFNLLNLVETVDVSLDVVWVQQNADNINILVLEHLLSSLICNLSTLD
jgi:hypothetical protein